MLIFLVGFSGSGKSFWGKRWAATFNFDHVDIDDLIEEEEGKAVTAIFEEQGEESFRRLENKALEKVLDRQNLIVSCGGGLPCFNGNMERMNTAGITVYLEADGDFLYDRLMHELDKRPLLKVIPPAETKNYIRDKLAERKVFYEKAEITLQADGLSERSFAPVLVHFPKL